MKAISVKLNSLVSNTNIIGHDVEKLTLRFILWSFAVLALIYVILLGNMVFNIVERKSFEISARTLSNEVGSLELQYLSLSNGIDLAFSHSLGFKEAKASFATRKPLGYAAGADNDL